MTLQSSPESQQMGHRKSKKVDLMVLAVAVLLDKPQLQITASELSGLLTCPGRKTSHGVIHHLFNPFSTQGNVPEPLAQMHKSALL